MKLELNVAKPLSDNNIDRLAQAIGALNPKPREYRWTSLTLCIVDAVWSIGARYATVVKPTVFRVAEHFGVQEASVRAESLLTSDPLPLDRFAGLDLQDLVSVTNRQRTSTRGGILKAEASLKHAEVFLDHDVASLSAIANLFTDQSALESIESELAKIPGEGNAGVRRGYLWMLVGNDDVIKPDRMVLRWLRSQGIVVSAEQARMVIADVVDATSQIVGRRLTPWEIDHAMWEAGRRLPASR